MHGIYFRVHGGIPKAAYQKYGAGNQKAGEKGEKMSNEDFRFKKIVKFFNVEVGSDSGKTGTVCVAIDDNYRLSMVQLSGYSIPLAYLYKYVKNILEKKVFESCDFNPTRRKCPWRIIRHNGMTGATDAKVEYLKQYGNIENPVYAKRYSKRLHISWRRTLTDGVACIWVGDFLDICDEILSTDEKNVEYSFRYLEAEPVTPEEVMEEYHLPQDLEYYPEIRREMQQKQKQKEA
jgi:hypothetical protein